MRSAVALVVLTACGRVGFGTDGVTDALPLSLIDTSVAEAYPMTVLDDHPIAYYRLDESSDTTAAVDVSGHANHGGYNIEFGGAGSFTTSGALVADSDLDPAVSFDGGGNPGNGGVASVVLPDSVAPWGSDFTVEGWIKPLAVPPTGWNDAFFLLEHHQVSGFRTGWTFDFLPVFWTSEAGRDSTVEGSVALVLGAWNHLAFTKSGITVTIYVNGALSAQASVDYSAPAADDPMIENCFGACHGMPSTGVFDELAIYDYALPQARVTAHYNTGAGLASQ